MYHQVKMSKICLSMEKMTKLCILWSHFLQKHINRYIHVYRRMCRNNLDHTQVNCTTHSKMRTWSGFAYSLSAMYTFILFESFIVLCHFLVKKILYCYFLKSGFMAKLSRRYGDFPYSLCAPLMCSLLHFNVPHQTGHFWQRMNIHGHSVTTQIP